MSYIMKIDTKIWTADEVADYIAEITPFEPDVPKEFLRLVRKSKKNFIMKKVKISDILANIKNDSVKEYVESKSSRYGDNGESSYEPSPDELNDPIVILDGEVIDGYSRLSTHYHNNEQFITALVSE